MIIGFYPANRLIQKHLEKLGIVDNLSTRIRYQIPTLLPERSSYFKIFNENDVLLKIPEIFRSFNSIERIFYKKIREDNLYIVFFICNRMRLEEEEKVIDLEIEFEDSFPEFNFSFMVIRRDDESLEECFDVADMIEL